MAQKKGKRSLNGNNFLAVIKLSFSFLRGTGPKANAFQSIIAKSFSFISSNSTGKKGALQISLFTVEAELSKNEDGGGGATRANF